MRSPRSTVLAHGYAGRGIACWVAFLSKNMLYNIVFSIFLDFEYENASQSRGARITQASRYTYVCLCSRRIVYSSGSVNAWFSRLSERFARATAKVPSKRAPGWAGISFIWVSTQESHFWRLAILSAGMLQQPAISTYSSRRPVEGHQTWLMNHTLKRNPPFRFHSFFIFYISSFCLFLFPPFRTPGICC